MRWTSFLTYLSIVALVAAVISQAVGWTGGRAWFLLLWSVLLLPVSIGHRPSHAGAGGRPLCWRLGTVAVVILVILQALGRWPA